MFPHKWLIQSNYNQFENNQAFTLHQNSMQDDSVEMETVPEYSANV